MIGSSQNPTRRHANQRLAVLGVSLLIGLSGCAKYAEVSSEEALTIIRQLYTACSAKDAELLAKTKARVETALKSSDCSAEEAKAFFAIIRQAESGEWEKAAREAYRYAQDQVR